MTLDFTVTLDQAATGTATVDYATADGTATAGEDYTATSGTLTFAAGETAKTVSVPVLDDAHDEPRETLTLTLTNPAGLRITDGEATGTIVNTEAPTAPAPGDGTAAAFAELPPAPDPTDPPEETEDTAPQQPDAPPAVSFVIYHVPTAGAAAVDRYTQATTLLTDAGIAYRAVTGDVRVTEAPGRDPGLRGDAQTRHRRVR